MRRTANPWSFKSLLVGGGVLAIVVAAQIPALAADTAKAGGPMEAILRPVNRNTGETNPDISLGTAKFTPTGDKVQVVIQVNGISVAGSEEGAAADGSGNTYPRTAQIFNGTCETAVKSGTSGAERLPDVPVRSDGSGTLFATTTTAPAKLAGQTVILMKASKPGAVDGVPVACGVIQSK